MSSALNAKILIPNELFCISSIAPKTGMSRADRPRIPAKRNTIGDYLFHFFITLSRSFIPAIDPRMHQPPVQRA